MSKERANRYAIGIYQHYGWHDNKELFYKKQNHHRQEMSSIYWLLPQALPVQKSQDITKGWKKLGQRYTYNIYTSSALRNNWFHSAQLAKIEFAVRKLRDLISLSASCEIWLRGVGSRNRSFTPHHREIPSSSLRIVKSILTACTMRNQFLHRAYCAVYSSTCVI